MFSYTFEKPFRMLAGLWFKMSYLSGFPLLRGTTELILALSGIIHWRKQQFIVCVEGFTIISAPILINFEGVVCAPTPLLMYISFKNFLTPGDFICWKLQLFTSEPNLFQSCF